MHCAGVTAQALSQQGGPEGSQHVNLVGTRKAQGRFCIYNTAVVERIFSPAAEAGGI